MKLKPNELHQHHLSYDAKGTGWRVDLGHAASIRIETGNEMSSAVKRAIALRLAVCWNILEGIPTAALLDGAVADGFEAGRQLCDEIEQGAATAWPALRKLAAAFRDADHQLAEATTDVKCGCTKSKAA